MPHSPPHEIRQLNASLSHCIPVWSNNSDRYDGIEACHREQQLNDDAEEGVLVGGVIS
jgi:hypothetical protein